jgi:hypothetical protein
MLKPGGAPGHRGLIANLRKALVVVPFLVVACALFLFASTITLPVYLYFDCGRGCPEPIYLWQSLNEIAEGLVAAAVLSLLFVFKWPRFPSWLSKPLAPRLSKRLITSLVLAGAAAFALFAFVTSTYYTYSFSHDFVRAFHSFHYQIFPNQGSSFGSTGFEIWCLTVFCLTLRTGFIGAMKAFGFPAILFLMAMLLVFDHVEMALHVTLFMSWAVNARTWYYIPVVSNWFTLIVASSLTVLSHFPSSPKKCD